ncbi:hypothetical protein RVR_4311 [Actinacidiphila reveromycinica]|uniref:DUF485 domain-containing protein n=1 Tax=Actinacidiphila reveromycinica TaxID=659352 RepID=A0A7U3VP10_9ACTN|nr:hypothetical protein [Streptomyces sp. SN-593]BBA98210.1 hypothetical protein RVR_4311 [Streptomyces sp. SN-593]
MSAGQQPGPPPRRTAVSGPRRHRPGGWSARARPADLHAQPRLAQVYVRSLVRDQLRLALGVLAVLAVVLGGVPAAFALLPGLRTAEVHGFRLAWLLLGVVAYPVLLGMAWFHVRHAERVERDFTDLLNGPDPGTAPGSTGVIADSPAVQPGSGRAASDTGAVSPGSGGTGPHRRGAAPAESGSWDSGSRNAGAQDTGSPDADSRDSGSPDAGTARSGSADPGQASPGPPGTAPPGTGSARSGAPSSGTANLGPTDSGSANPGAG